MQVEGKIVLVRVDNRLVHGQVGGPWSASLDVNVLVVVDDEVVLDPLQQRLMEFVAKSNNIRILFFSIDEFVEAVQDSSPHSKMFLVVRNVQTVKKLLEKDLPIDAVNLGNMHYEKGKVPLSRKVYINEEDAVSIQSILDHGVTCFVQDVPGSYREEVTTLIHIKFKK
ncbi:PTS galactosamine transporter subunit IIB [Anaerorhabdus sp.]|uniref:PTS galactosamine transporter subunit IIB n=1 Tax=Anaerorhabdus sp. TaxID=1872524 RepID=UPI002FCBEB99